MTTTPETAHDHGFPAAPFLGRLAGALLLRTDGRHYLIGNTKHPCNFQSRGLVAPAAIDAVRSPYVRLETAGRVIVDGRGLELPDVPVRGEDLAALLAKRLLITRNGSVSERLWRLITGQEEDTDDEEVDAPVAVPTDANAASVNPPIQARWLVEMPSSVWDIVRDTVLRCV